jgi:hypothetical protein
MGFGIPISAEGGGRSRIGQREKEGLNCQVRPTKPGGLLKYVWLVRGVL